MRSYHEDTSRRETVPDRGKADARALWMREHDLELRQEPRERGVDR